MKNVLVKHSSATHTHVDLVQDGIVLIEAEIPTVDLQKNLNHWIKLGWSINGAEKVRAVEITIDRAEGPTALCVAKTFHGFDCWTLAHAWLCQNAKTAPKSGGYDKHDFKIVFADGETYEGRLDVVHLSKATPDLPSHIRDFIQFLTGDFCPSHLKQADYDRCTGNQTTRDEAKAYLKKYQIG